MLAAIKTLLRNVVEASVRCSLKDEKETNGKRVPRVLRWIRYFKFFSTPRTPWCRLRMHVRFLKVMEIEFEASSSVNEKCRLKCWERRGRLSCFEDVHYVYRKRGRFFEDEVLISRYSSYVKGRSMIGLYSRWKEGWIQF